MISPPRSPIHACRKTAVACRKTRLPWRVVEGFTSKYMPSGKAPHARYIATRTRLTGTLEFHGFTAGDPVVQAPHQLRDQRGVEGLVNQPERRDLGRQSDRSTRSPHEDAGMVGPGGDQSDRDHVLERHDRPCLPAPIPT